MPPEVWAALILVAGGVLLAIAGIIVVRTAARWPEIVARIAQVEIVAGEALEIATKARRLASPRTTRRGKTTVDPSAEPDPSAARPPAASGWVPGATRGGARFEPLNGAAEEIEGAPTPIGFADDG